MLASFSQRRPDFRGAVRARRQTRGRLLVEGAVDGDSDDRSPARAPWRDRKWSEPLGVNSTFDRRAGLSKDESLWPTVTRTAIRFTQSMISSVTNRGRLRFMIYSGALNVWNFKPDKVKSFFQTPTVRYAA